MPPTLGGYVPGIQDVPANGTRAIADASIVSATTTDHAVSQESKAGLAGDLAITGDGGAPPRPRTRLGHVSATVLEGGQGGGLDASFTAGSLADLRGTASRSAATAPTSHAGIGDRVGIMLGDGPVPARPSWRSIPAPSRSATSCSRLRGRELGLLRLVDAASLRPHVPLGRLGAILGASAPRALALPTRRALVRTAAGSDRAPTS